MNRFKYRRVFNTVTEKKLIILVLLILLTVSLFISLPSNRASAEDLPYKILSLDRNITVRENKTLSIIDTFNLSFVAEHRSFVYRLPREIKSEKVVGNKTYHTKSIAYLSNVAVTINGSSGRSQVTQQNPSNEYLIEIASVEGKLSGKPIIAIAYDYDIAMDRNKKFDDLTIPLTYNRFTPQKLNVSITFPKDIKDAEITFQAAAESDKYVKTDSGIEYSYSDPKLERTEAVVMQILLGKNYFTYDSVFSIISGLYYAAFAITLACIVASGFLYIRKKCAQKREKGTVNDSGYIELPQISVCILGIVPILLSIFIYTVIAQISYIFSIGLGTGSVIGYFIAFYEWGNKKPTTEKLYKRLPYTSIAVFCIFFLGIYSLLLFAFGSFAFSLDIFYIGIIAPIWATISRIILWPSMQSTKTAKLCRFKKDETNSKPYVYSSKQAKILSSVPPNMQSSKVVIQQKTAVKENRKISKQATCKIGVLAMFLSIASVIMVGAFTVINQADGFIDGTGILVGYEERLEYSSNSNHSSYSYYVYCPIIRYEYEGVTYTETAPSGSEDKTRAVGESVDIQISPLIPSEFVIKSAQSIVWTAFFVIAVILFMLLTMAIIYPYLKKKYPFYEFGGILFASNLIVFSVGSLAVLYFSMHAEGIGHFFTQRPWAYFLVPFAIIGVLMAAFEIVRAIRIAWNKKRNIDKYNNLRNKKYIKSRKKSNQNNRQI